MRFYKKYRNYGIIIFVLLFVFNFIFVSNVFLTTTCILFVIWFFGLAPIAIISSQIDKNNNIHNNNHFNNSQYQAKSLVTQYEKYFLDIIEKNFSEDYRVMPQVPLSSIVNKNKEFSKQYQGELYRTIDIGIFDKDTFAPLLMIEINDSTHKQADRYKRDLKVREILDKANIPLLTFYSNMPNKENYVINRVEKFLEK